MNALSEIHALIEERVEALRRGYADWPCAKGCDACCRGLAEVPRLTAPEWYLLRQGLAALPSGTQEEIARKVAALGTQPSRPVVCPLLDRASGACPVYLQRPVACRSYGFYVQRGLGLYCRDMETQVAAGAFADVIWGNHDAIDRSLAALGQARLLTEWFQSGPS